MPQSVAHRAQFADHDVELVRLGHEHLAVDARPSVRREHAPDLVKREAGGSPDLDQRQSFQYIRVEKPAQASSADRSDQPLLLIISKCRSGHAGPLSHLCNIQIAHPLDLKLT